MSASSTRLGSDRRVKSRRCPSCGEPLTGATPLLRGDDPDLPDDGDLPEGCNTICIACAAPLRLEQGAFRILSGSEVYAVVKEVPGFGRLLFAAAMCSMTRRGK